MTISGKVLEGDGARLVTSHSHLTEDALFCECQERGASLTLTSVFYIRQVPNLISYQLQTLQYHKKLVFLTSQQLVDKQLSLLIGYGGIEQDD